MLEGSVVSVRELADWLLSRVPGDRRYILGIVGPPAAGKSTLAVNLAAALTAEHGVGAQIAPMDGFHKTSAALIAEGALHRKGEPDTFEVARFVRRLALLRDARLGAAVGWPIYDRGVDDPVPEAIGFRDERVAVVEGNYLLLDHPGWREVRDLLDEVWFLDAEDETIERRLTHRHLFGGRTAAQTRTKIAESDMANARLIAPSAARADLVLRESGGDYLVRRIRS